MAKKPQRELDKLRCPGSSYIITREVCRGRRRRGFGPCRRCPENSDQLEIFSTPLQVQDKEKKC